MATEEKPARRGKPAKTAEADFTYQHANLDVIRRHCAQTGTEVPNGLYLDDLGKPIVDEKGIRHQHISMDSDPQMNRIRLNVYRKEGFEVIPDDDGMGYELTIPESKYEENLKRYEKRSEYLAGRDAGKGRTVTIGDGQTMEMEAMTRGDVALTDKDLPWESEQEEDRQRLAAAVAAGKFG